VKQLGHALLSFPVPGKPTEQEYYFITLPSLHIESLIYGTPFVELNRSTQIVSSTGYASKIDYSGKGWVSGKKNSFTAILYHQSEGERKPLYTADGQWSDTFVLRDARGKKGEIEKYTVNKSKTTPLTIAELDQQDLYESRRAWRDVALAIERGDMDATSVAKSRIENAQREMRRIEKEEGREWQRRFFKRVELKDDEPLKGLLDFLGINDPSCPAALDSDKTGGIWRFVPGLAKDASPPYHSDISGRGLGLASPTDDKDQAEDEE
jgi:hypothetical protein